MAFMDIFRYAERTGAMVHTIGERYDTKVKMNTKGGAFTDMTNVVVLSPETFVNMGIPRKQAENVAMYVAGHEGAHTRVSDTSITIQELKKAQEEGYELKRLNNPLQIAEDVRVDYNTIYYRPGFKDIRERADEALMNVGFDIPSSDTDVNTMIALSCMTYGVDLRKTKPYWAKVKDVDWELVKQASNMIMAEMTDHRATATDAADVAKRVYDLLWGKPSKITGVPGGTPDGEEDDKRDTEVAPAPKGEGTGKGDKKDAKDDDTEDTKEADAGESSSEEDHEYDDDEYDDDEYDDDEYDDDDEKKDYDDDAIAAMVKDMMESAPIAKDDSKLSSKLDIEKQNVRKTLFSHTGIESSRKKDEEQFGTKVLSPEEDMKLFTHASSAEHAGVHLAYVKRSEKTTKSGLMSSPAYQRYCEHKRIYDGQAAALARRLIQDMRAARDPEGYVSDNGIIVAGKVWKADKTSNTRIFNKEVYEEVGEYVVDILLDASGSQRYRERDIAIQGFILAEAFSMAGIPCQVTKFNRSSYSTVLRQLRDYDAPREDNVYVFSYLANDDNRDGHAIRAIEWCIKRRPEENKVIIVLSDGQPADSSGGNSRSAEEGGAMQRYCASMIDSKHHKSAIEDVAINVRRIRASGITLLGVYTGHAEAKSDLKAEQIMYGNDFAFIPDVTDFSKVVGNYLHRQITKM